MLPRADNCVRHGPGAEGSPALLGGGDLKANRFASLQVQSGEGPALSAFTSGAAIRCNDLATDSRYPVFGPLAAREGIGGVPVHPIVRDNASRGVIVTPVEAIVQVDPMVAHRGRPAG